MGASGILGNISFLLRVHDAASASQIGSTLDVSPTQDIWSWLADVTVPELRASHGQRRIAASFKERQDARLWSGRLGAGSGTALSLFAFAGLAKVMNVVL